jgi:lipopolysaccharide export system permease protein
MSDTDSQAVTLTSLYRSFTLPVMILGSMLIGIAAASRYRRSVRYGDTVLFAVITGFVLFVVNEMAVRAGNAGVLAPIVAASGPAIVSVIVGMTALLYSQDGRT